MCGSPLSPASSEKIYTNRNNPKGNWIIKYILSKQAPGPNLLFSSKQQDQGNMIKALKIFIPFMQCATKEFHFSTPKTLPLVYS